MRSTADHARDTTIMNHKQVFILGLALAVAIVFSPITVTQAQTIRLSDKEVENLVRRSYQYVAMYNVNNKFAITQGGWNTVDPDTELKDHTMTDISRPNNDTLYIGSMLDLRHDPVIVSFPAFDSEYASLMVTAYDHYVTIPMSTRLGDFERPERVLFYSARTEGYSGEPVDGVDRIVETTGDFVSAIIRVMPHANEPERFARIVEQMKSTSLETLSELRDEPAKPIDDVSFPAVGATDADVYGTNLLEVMQFVFNHLTFDPDDALDQALLAAYEPFGISPGSPWDPDAVTQLDGERLRAAAEELRADSLGGLQDPARAARNNPLQFQPKGETALETLVDLSVIGPIGLPQQEAAYAPLPTEDGTPLNAMHDYVIRMPADALPPANAFWSFTLYALDTGHFLPNDRKKYSVGKNAGMELSSDGGIEIHVAAEQPEGVPAANWLPIERRDQDLDIIIRIYAPDLAAMESWQAPVAVKVE